MRWIISALLVLTLGISLAWAAAPVQGPGNGDLPATSPAAYAANPTAYDDVDKDHWAYNALNYLTNKGVLEGYPDGFFKGDRTLTRYEFAQAIARLLDSIDQGKGDDSDKVMAETLRAEFSDQLADQN